ncbi:hypothetical protein KTU01_34470 [Kocuria turfanensis]|uniref:Uncharacterized protein n=1 Tax=Kocuria turfanensis TaxID=388357 RepID=A0A512IHZ9_9MICC|nr:hypothetical protein KTU01_34470 [Kocuria turfanensis]
MPKPFSGLNHLTTPVAIPVPDFLKGRASPAGGNITRGIANAQQFLRKQRLGLEPTGTIPAPG